MKKNILPILLIAGAALAFMAFRRRGGVTVTADMPIKQTAEEFETEYQETVKPSPIEVGTKIIQTLFPKKTAQQKAAKKAQKAAVKSAVKSGVSKKKAKAVTQALVKPAFIRGFDDTVLV